jgi:hypothetical protein
MTAVPGRGFSFFPPACRPKCGSSPRSARRKIGAGFGRSAHGGFGAGQSGGAVRKSLKGTGIRNFARAGVALAKFKLRRRLGL